MNHILLKAALKWGVDNPDEADRLLPLSETFKFNHSKIGLFEYNGLWGYCLSLNLKGSGSSYGAFLKFCNPYQNATAALTAAVVKIEQEIARNDNDHKEDHKVRIWARGLITPRQLELIPSEPF